MNYHVKKSELNSAKVKNTRLPSLGYTCEAPKQWSIIDKVTDAAIGAKYRSKDELLADLDRFAKERGYDQ